MKATKCWQSTRPELHNMYRHNGNKEERLGCKRTCEGHAKDKGHEYTELHIRLPKRLRGLN